MMRFTWLPVAMLAIGCVETAPEENVQEVFTTVALTFTPQSGGAAIMADFLDLNGEVTIDDIALTNGETYDLGVEFFNELEDPIEDVTLEIMDEDDEHQVFFTGGAIDSIVTHTYSDMDGGGLPIGLDNEIAATNTGSDTFTVTLRHLPPEDGTVVKVAGLEDTVAASGIGAIAGDTDITADFDLTVE
ncbi:MAG: type 1 periplasmic binding fold superfamily protein [Myxococcota bacterium]